MSVIKLQMMALYDFSFYCIPNLHEPNIFGLPIFIKTVSVW